MATSSPAPALAAALAELEAQRKKVLVRGALSLLIGGGLLLALLAAGLTNELPVPLLVIGGAVVVVIAIVAFTMPFQTYRGAFKQRLLAPLVQSVNPELVYDPEGQISADEFRASSIYLDRIDRYECEDYFAGTLGATAMRFCEVHAEERHESTDSKGNRQTSWETIFRGVFFCADFNKHFSGTTVVLPDTAERLFGRFGQKLQALRGGLSRGELVKLEDPEFEREFVVYASDQIEARYILSTSLMQRLLAFRAQCERPFALSFTNSTIYIALQTSKNLFEPPLLKTLDRADLLDEYAADLAFVLSIVESLNLNTRIWSKGAPA